MLDEHKRDESTDDDHVRLLHQQRTLPVDADHPDDAEVPHKHCRCEVVYCHVVSFQQLADWNGYISGIII